VTNPYDTRYAAPGLYWGAKPSAMCLRVLDLLPPERPLRLLDVGCGEGRNAVFFARNGYRVTAFDSSPVGVEKAERAAADLGLSLEAFVADVNVYRPSESFDVIFSTGVLHYVPRKLRTEVLAGYREATLPGGLNAFSVFVAKPFIAPAPDAEPTAHLWRSGELLTHYADWCIEYSVEEVFDCDSGGVAHQHCTNRVVARRASS
jgi:tellurite methyltransferase